jgi:glycosyltransferase involved in cell wall biosynthesis
MKIAVVHDHLEWRGGGERTALLMAKALGADFITAYAATDTYPELRDELGPRFHALTDRVFHLRGFRFFWLRHVFWKNRWLLRRYDLLITSGQPALEAVARYARRDAVRIAYTHTPPRRVFDMYETSRAAYPKWTRPIFALFIRYWRYRYLHAVDRMDSNIANSETIKERLRRYTGREVNAIIRPPIRTELFRHIDDGDYFVSWARLDEAKRVELIVEAFKKMPEEKLIIASDGPRADECRRLAAGCPNIKFVGRLEDRELAELVGKSRAAIYIPVDEDAGMTHLEANAAGKPVLGVDEGGLRDTIIDGETGFKIKADPTADDVIAAAKKMTRIWCASKRRHCVDHAAAFSYEVFARKMKEAVDANSPDRPVIGIDASRWEDPRYPGEGRRTGVEVYTKNLLESLAAYLGSRPVRLRFYAPRSIPTLPLTIQKIIPRRRFWTLLGLRSELKRRPVDRFFTPSYSIPKTAPSASFAIVHDLAFQSHPLKYSLIDWLRQEEAWHANRRRAEKLIAVSAAVRDQIARHYPLLARKTVFVPPGYAPNPLMRGNTKKKDRIIFIGRVDKKKSIGLLIEAFRRLSDRFPSWRLDIVGNDGYGADAVKAAAAGNERIRFHGYVSEDEKAELLSEAAILCHPSSSEGSALTVLEAWDAGAGALVADIPVMREIGKEAVCYFAPHNVVELKERLAELMSDENARVELSERGRQELKRYSWATSAETIGQIIFETGY